MTISCNICPRECDIPDGRAGYCSVYSNVDDELHYGGMGVFSALNIELIDKKPFFHYLPGEKTFSIGSYGCNLDCHFCQNSEISQEEYNFYDIRKYEEHLSLTDIFKQIKDRKIPAIVFTYNEPLLHLPFYRTIAERAKKEGIKVLFKTNGFVNEHVFDEAMELADGFNIDLKLMRNHKVLGLSSVKFLEYLDNFYSYVQKCVEAKKHVEVSAICIYRLNGRFISDCFDRLLEISDVIPVHLLKYIKCHNMEEETTDDLTLSEWRLDLMKRGFRYVYNGYPANVQNTFCQYCGSAVVERDGFVPVKKFYTVENSRTYCDFCKRILPIVDASK